METVLAIAGIIIEISAAVVVVWKIFSWGNKIVDSERCQLRSMMLGTYYKHQDTKEIRQYEYENFVKAYNAYKALNGNSFIDKVYKEVQTWTVQR